MTYNKILFEVKGEIAYLGFGHNNEKSMTVLDSESLKDLDGIVSELKKSVKAKKVAGVILHTLKNGCFLAGADINMIASLKTEDEAATGAAGGQRIFSDLEDLQVPKIACVDGVCLGGGFELVLACDKILASDSNKTMFALPEVKLGLIPGFGGTYRLPQKIGIPNAMDMILTGKNVRAKKAKRMGLVSEIYAKEMLLEMALRHLKSKEKKKSLGKSLSHFAMDNFVTRKIIFQKVREAVLKKTKGFYQAPLTIIDVMESGISKSRKNYLPREAAAFGELCISDQSQNLQHIFFLMEGTKKIKGSAKAGNLDRGAVLGAGTMGGGIAWLMADNGMSPILKDINLEALELGLKQSGIVFKKAVKKRQMSNDDFERKQRSISPCLNYDDFKNTDLVIEAIVENMELKKKVFAELEKYVRDDTVITSNTSSLSVAEMSSAMEKPERFAGLHFFNPVNMMPLVEIITHEKTSQEVVASLHKWAVRVKKTPIIVKDGPGFLVNRVLMPFLNESAYLLEEGLSIKDLDRAVLNFGMPMGPCRLLDEVGFDIGLHASNVLHEGLGERMKPCSFLSRLVDQEFLGKKNGRGFYLYDEKGKQSGINEELASKLPSKTIKMDEVDIQKRLILPMINEAANILHDGIVESAALVDVGVIFGLGFPPFRGGLLRYADYEGLDRILECIENLASGVSAVRYEPSPYLKNLVEKKKKFYD